MATKKITKVPITIWFPSWKKRSHIEIYNTMNKAYQRTNELVYSSIQERFDQYQDEVYEEYLKRMSPEDIDFSDVSSEAYNRVEQDLLMRYQFHFSSIVNLYQVFEQQIRKLLYEELNHHTNNVITKEMPEFVTKFGDIKSLLKGLNFPIGSNPSWPIIDELNKLANTYKHGDGNSATKLYKRDKNIFIDASTRFIEDLSFTKREQTLLYKEELTTNTEIVLREDKTPFDKYIQAIIKFWETFPEHLTSVAEFEIEDEEAEENQTSLN